MSFITIQNRIISTIILVVPILFTSCSQPADVAEINLIPKPLELKTNDGFFRWNENTRFIVNSDNAYLIRASEIFAEIIDQRSLFPVKPEVFAGDIIGKNIVQVNLVDQIEHFGQEGYELLINPDQITVSAASPSGAFYGLQTLRQLFPPSLEDQDTQNKEWHLPSVSVFDKPCFSWRGDMLDVSRHFLPIDFIKKNIDYLARYKMNIFHWHLTDDQGWRIEIKGYPKLTEVGAWRVDRNDEPWHGREPQKPDEKATYGGFYSQEEIKEVVQYANDRFITIIPEIDMPGHSRSAIASYPEISCDGGHYYVATGGIMEENTYCPGKETTFEFIEGILDEVLSLFPGPYFHVGGDECNKSAWEICSDCQSRMQSEGLKDEDELQSYFISRVEKIVNANGKKLIGWDEILEGGLAPNATVMSWRGISGGIEAAKMGHDVIMSPTTYCYLDLKQGDPELEPPLGYSQSKLSTAYSFDPVPEELSEQEASHILGIQGNLWGESIQNEENANYMLFPRLLAIAEVGWTPKEMRDWNDFIPRLEYNLIRLENIGIGYAPSMYNVSITASPGEKKNKLYISFITEHGKIPIRYTLDGSDPSVNSDLYEEPVEIDGNSIIKAAAYEGEKRLGRITTREVNIHKAAGAEAKFINPWSDRYTGGGVLGLTDCLRGTAEFSSGKWMGFDGTDLDVTIDLSQVINLNSISLSCLEGQRQWIFLPLVVEVFVSKDGETFKSVGVVENPLTNQPEPRTIEISFDVNSIPGRYIRIVAENVGVCPDWHQGKGGKAWLFVDEIIVE